jgi:pimeloyl-ACP methyl ester carboxylesterase
METLSHAILSKEPSRSRARVGGFSFWSLTLVQGGHAMITTPSQGRTEVLNGLQLYFEVHGTGEPLLFLHGFSGCSQDWIPSITAWGSQFQLIIPDLRGHGRSGILSNPFRHEDAATDVFALLDHLGILTCKGVGISGGGNILLHMATRQPDRVKAMVLVSATPYFPEQARRIMGPFANSIPTAQREHLHRIHPGGEPQITALLNSAATFATSYDDMNFTPPILSSIQARTLIVQGDRDPLYPVELSLEMARSIPWSSLWILPNSGHGPVFDEKWPDFQKAASVFLLESTP